MSDDNSPRPADPEPMDATNGDVGGSRSPSRGRSASPARAKSLSRSPVKDRSRSRDAASPERSPVVRSPWDLLWLQAHRCFLIVLLILNAEGQKQIEVQVSSAF